MIDVIYILLVMAGLYVIWLAVGVLLKKNFKIKICAICATVVSTWMGLMVLKLVGFDINKIILAILMGQSVTGFMYLLEREAKSTNKNLLLMKPLVIIFGTLIVYWIIGG